MTFKRVVICLNFSPTPEHVFGPFDSFEEAVAFEEKHDRICKLKHFIRKMYDPRFGKA